MPDRWEDERKEREGERGENGKVGEDVEGVEGDVLRQWERPQRERRRDGLENAQFL